MRKLFISSLVALSLVGILSSCSGSPMSSHVESTLNGATVTGNGVSVRELSPQEIPVIDEFSSRTLFRDGDNLIFEYGGSGSAACASNFTAIERNGEVITVTHRVGQGEQGPCTSDYRFSYFLIELDEPISDDVLLKVFSSQELVQTLTLSQQVATR